jgi:hypothetical protein
MDRFQWTTAIVLGGLAVLMILVLGNTSIGEVVWSVVAHAGG